MVEFSALGLWVHGLAVTVGIPVMVMLARSQEDWSFMVGLLL